MIRCVCMNPSLDQSCTLPSFSFDSANRIHTTRTDPGGKGVNAAVVLRRLGADADLVLLCPAEGSETMQCFLKSENVRFTSIPCPRQMRRNLKIQVEDLGKTVEINGDMHVSEKVCAEAREKILHGLAPDDWLLLNGSLPQGAAETFYADLVRRAPCRTAVDCDGKSLRAALHASPALIKPNLEEFKALTGVTSESPAELAGICRGLIRDTGLGMVCLTLGAKGAMLVTESESWFVPAVPVQARGTHGAGDTLLSALIYQFTKRAPLPDALRYASAAAAASVQKEGTELATAEETASLYPLTRAEKIN